MTFTLTRHSPWALVLGDTVCLSLFVAIGLRTHDSQAPLMRFVINILPLLGMWLVVAWRMGAFHWPRAITVRAVLEQTVVAWLVAAPLALLVRAWVLSAGLILIPFFAVTLGLGGTLLLLWRGAWARWCQRR